MERMTIGQMARLHGVSEKTLRVYHELGLLVPEEVNEYTGYRRYGLLQSASVDMIQELKSIGLSLGEIKELLNKKDVSYLRTLAMRQYAELEKEKRRISLAQFTVRSILENIDLYNGKEELENVLVRHRPKRRILCFNCCSGPSNWGRETAENQLWNWEKEVRGVKTEMQQRGIPLSLFHNVSCTVKMEDLKRRDLTYFSPFIFVDDEFNEAETDVMPEGWYISVLCDGMVGANGLYREGRMIMRLLDEIGERGYEVAGDYFGEVVGETPAFLYEGRDMMVRLQIPVNPSGQACGEV